MRHYMVQQRHGRRRRQNSCGDAARPCGSFADRLLLCVQLQNMNG